ncbi:hypothetical protein MKW98_011838, partial [Papaver atlanticum]
VKFGSLPPPRKPSLTWEEMKIKIHEPSCSLSKSDLLGNWQDCPSFNDDGLSKIFSRRKGTCMARDDYKKS